MNEPGTQDFAPKIFVVGRQNELLSPLLELILKEEQNRFGVRSAGIDPSGRIHPELREFLSECDFDEVDPTELESTPISVALDDHVQLVAFTEPSVREDGPIIATTGDKVTLETDELRERLREANDRETFREGYEQLREKAANRVLDTLGLC